MENLSVKSESYKDITVTALVTGRVEVNGGRVGDPASWDELEREESYKPGTINIMLHINVDLSEGALTRAMVTCTEAKTAALQELVAPSRYSMGLATGSGTDGTIIIANTDSNIYLTNAGKHCKLGELIGVTVKAAVKGALLLQTGLSPESQHNILRRIDRFGITEDYLWEKYSANGGGLNRAKFSDMVHKLVRQDVLVTYTALYAHLIDQLMWELLSPAEALPAANLLLQAMDMPPVSAIDAMGNQECIDLIINGIALGIAGLLSVNENPPIEPEIDEEEAPADDNL